MEMNNKTYDILKWICLVVFPGFGALWTTLSDLWGFGYAVQVAGTLDALGVFLGALIGISGIKHANTSKKKSTKTTKKTDK